ncbi:hypothetical protein [Nocardia vaccinii]|uniref:hypothetical protein n=1 Tax=Nocardia vaccinii TaxID=1822 RepID=UPI000A6AF352|nr:hypothetical protein [Nocardia vaccinii]
MTTASGPDQERDALVEEVLDMNEDEVDLDYDLGDDEQADEVRDYQRYIADPPANLIIDYHEDGGRQGISRDLDQSWTRRRHRDEERAEDDRPAELAAMEVVEEPGD